MKPSYYTFIFTPRSLLMHGITRLNLKLVTMNIIEYDNAIKVESVEKYFFSSYHILSLYISIFKTE